MRLAQLELLLIEALPWIDRGAIEDARRSLTAGLDESAPTSAPCATRPWHGSTTDRRDSKVSTSRRCSRALTRARGAGDVQT